jgi:hypothetical protein
MNTARLTTNLNPDLINFITKQANALNKTKREILEYAISMYKKEIRRRETIRGCNEMADNKEEMGKWLSIANNPANL